MIMYCFIIASMFGCMCLIQTACLQLINAIVSTPDDLDFRLHLRNEFVRTGLADAVAVIYFPVVSL